MAFELDKTLLRLGERTETPHGATYVTAGAGEPVVLIHGVGLRLEAWAPQFDALAETHRVIAVDMPGHGGSAPIARGSDLAAYVTWCLRLFDDLGLDAVNVAGHSMGALIAGGCSVTTPERVRRVALVSAVHRRDPDASAAVRARAAEIAAGQIDPTTALTRWFDDGTGPPGVYEVVKRWLTEVDVGGYAAAYAAFAEGDRSYADRWGEFNGPALCLTGELDPNSTPQMTLDLAAAFGDGHAHIVAGHRHMVNMTAPDEVTAALRHWLTRKA